MTTEPKEMDFYEQWASLDDRALAKDPVSFRLPIHLLARLNALGEVFANRNRSDFIIDLLKAGLQKLEEGSFTTAIPGECEGENVVPSLEYLSGMAYRMGANKHYQELSKKAGYQNVPDLFPIKESCHG